MWSEGEERCAQRGGEREEIKRGTQTDRLADTETETEIDIGRDVDTGTGTETATDTESARDRRWQPR